MKLDAPVVSIAVDGAYVLATSEGRQLGAGSTDQLGFLKWSRDEKASYVSRSPQEGFAIVVGGGKLARRDVRTGEFGWGVPLREGTVCGLAPSSADARAAICLDNAIAIIDGTSGALVSTFRRSGDKLVWTDVKGTSFGQ
jgi:hypothetical protein